MKKIFALAVCILALILISFAKSLFVSDTSDKTVVKFSSWGSQTETTILKKLISEFETNNPDIKIEFLHIPQNYYQKIHLLFASGLEPDVIFINNQNIKMYINAGLLENLSPYFPEAKTDFFEEALGTFDSNGNIYAIPRDISNLVVFYNKDIFKKAGIKNPHPKTLNELKDLCEKIKTTGLWAFNFESNPLFQLNFIAANGGGAISDDLTRIIIGEKSSLDALNLYSDFVKKYKYSPSRADIGSMTTAQMFVSGKLAMYFSGRWIVPKIRELADFDWDVFAFPASAENKIYVDASGWAVAKNSKHKDEAVRFIKFLSNEKSSAQFTKSGLIIPARKNTALSEEFIDSSQKPASSFIFTDMLKNAKPEPVNENYGKIRDIIKEKVELMSEGNVTAEEAFDKKTLKKLNDLLN